MDARKRVSRLDEEHLWALEKELERAEVVNSADISPDVVTMQSFVRIEDLDTGNEMDYTLAFPADADITQNRISVLAPIGTAILGYREGDVIDWEVPGRTRRLRIVRVIYQSGVARGRECRVNRYRTGHLGSARIDDGLRARMKPFGESISAKGGRRAVSTMRHRTASSHSVLGSDRGRYPVPEVLDSAALAAPLSPRALRKGE